MTRPRLDQHQDQDMDTLRKGLSAHLAAGGSDALDALARTTGLSPEALAAFARGAGLAGWAGVALGEGLDQDVVP